jgi:hypothetical protein
MRFMVMHKVDAKMEAGEPPSKTIVEKMGAYVGAAIKAGVFKDGAGLHGSKRRVRLRFEGGKRTGIEKGPYEGGNELLASFGMIEAASMDEAVERASAIGAKCGGGDCEIEVGVVVEPWEIGVAPKPEREDKRRYLLLRKADAAFERGASAAGMAVAGETTLRPSRQGARLERSRRWTDGPFAESKELVAGFSIIEVPTLADAKKWAEGYGEILPECEVDVREVAS